MYLSVVLPQYNELRNLKAGVLQSVFNYLNKQTYTWEVIVIDDGSTDSSGEATAEIIKALKGFRQIKAEHKGKPFAIEKGINEATGDWILLADMDQSTPISELGKLIKYIDTYSVVIGSRGKKRNEASILRKTAGVVFSTYRRMLVLSKLHDTQCGFKLFRKDIIKKYFPMLASLKQSKV